MSSTTLRRVTLIDGTGADPQSDVDVIVDGELIAEIGVGLSPRGTVIEGGYVIPGLWETEGHLTRYSTGHPADMTLRWPEDGDFDRVRDSLVSYLVNGVTTVVDLGGPPETLAAIRSEQEAGELRGARLLFVGRQFTAVGGQPIVNGSTIAAVTFPTDDPREAREAVARAVEQYGIVGIKANYTVGGGPYPTAPLLRREVLDALVAAGAEHGLPVLVHIDDARAALEALEAGVDNIEHMFLPDPARHGDDILEVAEAARRHGAYWPFSLALWETLVRPADPGYLAELRLEGHVPEYVIREVQAPESIWSSPPRAMTEHYAARYAAGMDHVAAVRASGVAMTIATDAGNPAVFHGPGTRRELELMVAAGVSPLDAIVTATRHSAEKFRCDRVLGTVETGKIADLVLLERDPLDDIRELASIRAVLQAGRVFTPAALREEWHIR